MHKFKRVAYPPFDDYQFAYKFAVNCCMVGAANIQITRPELK
jgi:hypothetical protein